MGAGAGDAVLSRLEELERDVAQLRQDQRDRDRSVAKTIQGIREDIAQANSVGTAELFGAHAPPLGGGPPHPGVSGSNRSSILDEARVSFQTALEKQQLEVTRQIELAVAES